MPKTEEEYMEEVREAIVGLIYDAMKLEMEYGIRVSLHFTKVEQGVTYDG